LSIYKQTKNSLTAKKAQAMVEYILLISVVAVAAIFFVKFMMSEVFTAGFSELPANTSKAVSH